MCVTKYETMLESHGFRYRHCLDSCIEVEDKRSRATLRYLHPFPTPRPAGAEYWYIFDPRRWWVDTCVALADDQWPKIKNVHIVSA